jgi:hypothetical protein
MIEEGQSCMDIATQMAAVRKALDSTYVRMTVCFMQQELQHRATGRRSDDENGAEAQIGRRAGRRAELAGQGHAALTPAGPERVLAAEAPRAAPGHPGVRS